VPRGENVRLKDEHDKVEPCGGADDLGKEEEGGARLVSPTADA